MDTFPGDVCVDCHRQKVSGQSAQEDYANIMKGFANPERVRRVQEIRRSNAAGPRNSKKIYDRKRNQRNKDDYR